MKEGFKLAAVFWPWLIGIAGLLVLRGSDFMSIASWIVVAVAIAIGLGVLAYAYGTPPDLNHPD